MDSIEKLSTILPKLKHQLLFLNEREKLFKVNDENSTPRADSSISITNSDQPSYPIDSVNSLSANDNMNHQELEESVIDKNMKLFFSDEYLIPTLPHQLVEDIEAGALHKFAPHHTNRQILIDIISHDLINKYNLL